MLVLNYGEEEGGRIKPKGFVLFREPKWVRFQILVTQAFGSAGMGDGGEGGGRGDYRDYSIKDIMKGR
jgi:hypothetical protein